MLTQMLSLHFIPSQKGVVKLFDFGFARSLPARQTPDDLYRLTARMGTWRYMAPEVARGESYNLKCDVYSLALILWEMVVGNKPYSDLPNHSDDLRALVTAGVVRPELTQVPDGHWSALLEQAWDADIHKRSTVKQIHAALRVQLEKMNQGQQQKQ